MEWNDGDMTTNLKLICAALGLRKADIAEIMTLGGLPVSKSRADSWMRSAGATKNATGNSDLAGMRINRAGKISADEFRAFCAGLKSYLDNADSRE